MENEVKVLEKDLYLGDSSSKEMLEDYKENEMYEEYKKLVDTYNDKYNMVVLPAGTELELVKSPDFQGEPAIWKIKDKDIEILIYDWDD